jgi:phage gpG-like protein
MSTQFKPPDFMKIAEKLKKDRQRYAEVAGINFIKSNFFKQGFTDEAFTPWEKHKDSSYRQGGAILTATGFLRDSNEVVRSSQEEIVFGSYAQYAKIHNEGGTIVIRVTPKMRKYFWYMFKRTGIAKYKRMALSKQMKVKIPKRQFIGPSAAVMKDLDTWTTQQIQQRFNRL